MGKAEDEARAGRSVDAERLYAAARSRFEAALAIYPSYSPPIDGLAMIESLHGRQDEAVVLYEGALKAWPGNYASLTNWGSALWDQSKRKGVEASALHTQGRTMEAAELLRQADTGSRQALEKLDRAIQMMPSYAQAHLVRAMILEVYAADRPGAIAEFEEVLRLVPDHPQRTLIETELQRLRAQPGAANGVPPRTDRQ
jgi:Tfp pilus assembly protein PilF